MQQRVVCEARERGRPPIPGGPPSRAPLGSEGPSPSWALLVSQRTASRGEKGFGEGKAFNALC